jgi:hypothetical protein
LRRHPQCSQEHSGTDNAHLRYIVHDGRILQKGCGLRCHSGRKHEATEASTTAAATTAERACGLIFQSLEMNLQAIDYRGSRQQRRLIGQIGIKQTWSIMRWRIVIMLSGRMIGFNRDFQRPTIHMQILMMGISELQGDLLLENNHYEVTHRNSRT